MLSTLLITLLFTSTSFAKDQFIIDFGSCNRPQLPQPFWELMLKDRPDLFIFGGDVIYTDKFEIKEAYLYQKNIPSYQNFLKHVPVIGVWDDHDYGLNDGGKENSKKIEVQKLFLDFIDEPKNTLRRKREGVYASYLYWNETIKVILLDVRYHRDPHHSGGSVLGKTQWEWLENEIASSKAKLNIIVSGTQIISNKHPFETWGQFEHERERLIQLIKANSHKGAILISGDRHVGEISKLAVEGLPYPLVDITSSGLTHAYTQFSKEENPHRHGKTFADLHYGRLTITKADNKIKVMGEIVDQKRDVKNFIEINF